MRKPPKIFGSLLTEIVRTELCMYCGACIASCPVNVVGSTNDESPTLTGVCILCELCYYGCPRVELPLESIEKQIFGRPRRADETCGVTVGIYSARVTDQDLRGRGQDGGITTAILQHILEKGLVDKVITVGVNISNPWKPVPTIASTKESLVENAQSKYTATGSLSALADGALGYPDSDFAFVGLPCQLQALRRIASSPHGAKKLAERVKIAVSLFCFNTYKYKPLFTDYLKNQQGLDLSKITKIDCKSGRFKFYEGTNIAHEATVKDLQTFIHPGCGKCQDFSGELSDISVGNTGSEPGWCTVITRTSDSDKLFKEMADSGVIELKPAPSMIDAITKLSEAKRKRPAPYIRS